MSETISVHNMFSPCAAKIRASDKDLPVTLTNCGPDPQPWPNPKCFYGVWKQFIFC